MATVSLALRSGPGLRVALRDTLRMLIGFPLLAAALGAGSMQASPARGDQPAVVISRSAATISLAAPGTRTAAGQLIHTASRPAVTAMAPVVPVTAPALTGPVLRTATAAATTASPATPFADVPRPSSPAPEPGRLPPGPAATVAAVLRATLLAVSAGRAPPVHLA